jgi:hypothetical protein
MLLPTEGSAEVVLDLPIALNNQVEMRKLLSVLPPERFRTDDALGWTYQFWQAQRKEVNESGRKIGADELSPVTQLLTEDYMVEFLLHNTLGAWWAGSYFASPHRGASQNAGSLVFWRSRSTCCLAMLRRNTEVTNFVLASPDVHQPPIHSFSAIHTFQHNSHHAMTLSEYVPKGTDLLKRLANNTYTTVAAAES